MGYIGPSELGAVNPDRLGRYLSRILSQHRRLKDEKFYGEVASTTGSKSGRLTSKFINANSPVDFGRLAISRS